MFFRKKNSLLCIFNSNKNIYDMIRNKALYFSVHINLASYTYKSTAAVKASTTIVYKKLLYPYPLLKQMGHKRRTLAFVHFGLNTFDDKEWGYDNTNLKIFNPKKLYTDNSLLYTKTQNFFVY